MGRSKAKSWKSRWFFKHCFQIDDVAATDDGKIIENAVPEVQDAELKVNKE